MPLPRVRVGVLELELERPVVLLADVHVVELVLARGVVVHFQIRLHHNVDALPVPPLGVVTCVRNEEARPAAAVGALALVHVLPVRLSLHLAWEVRARDDLAGKVAVRVRRDRVVGSQPDRKEVVHLAVVVPPEHVVAQAAPREAAELPQPSGPDLVGGRRKGLVSHFAVASLRGGDGGHPRAHSIPELPVLLGEHELAGLGAALVAQRDMGEQAKCNGTEHSGEGLAMFVVWAAGYHGAIKA
mmetsp:Transcript_10228/g.31243  ORF Transcript_10228/g.31243 Transcript_10228/m.31243 type:complete len:243 (-) Transcript_10228:167-895(-)